MSAQFIHQADNCWTKLEGASESLEKELFDSLKIKSKNYAFDLRYRAGMWDGFERFYYPKTHRLLTGLVPYAKKLGFDIPEIDLSVKPENEFPREISLNGIEELEIYQEETRDLIIAGSRRGVFDHITGAGKSVEMGIICKLFPKLNITINVPTCTLLQQLRKDLEDKLGEEVGSFGCKTNNIQRITVVFQTMIVKYMKNPIITNLANRTQVMISDELQMVTPSFFPFLLKCHNAYYRYGFSGSFYDNDPVRVFQTSGHFGDLISKVSEEDTNEAGRTVPLDFFFYEYSIPKIQGDFVGYAEAYEEHISSNYSYNEFFLDKALEYYSEGKSILIMIKHHAHSELVGKILKQKMIKFENFNGRISPDIREKTKKRFKSGELQVLVATEQTIGVGVDIPRIHVLLNLGGGLSDDKCIQKYGRIIRAHEESEKERAIIIEPLVIGNKWFQRHSRARLKVANSYKTGTVKVISN